LTTCVMSTRVRVVVSRGRICWRCWAESLIRELFVVCGIVWSPELLTLGSGRS